MLSLHITRLLKSSNFGHFRQRMASSFVNEKNEPDLYQLQVQVQTRYNKTIPINCVFLDTKASKSDKGVVVGSHGAPGSHKDFKYVYPHLERFVGINWPGMGYSSYDHSLADDNNERVQIVQRVIDELNLDNIVFIGHSRGSENALKMAALNQNKCTGLILLNPIGLRPHRGIKPYFLVKFVAWLWKNIPFTQHVLNPVLFWLYHKIGLRAVDSNCAGICLNLMYRSDFEGQRTFIDKLNAGNVPVLTIYSGRDAFVEKPVTEDLANQFVDNQKIICSGDEDEALSQIRDAFVRDKTRHVSVCFPKDDHFLQKSRAIFIAQVVNFLLDKKAKQ